MWLPDRIVKEVERVARVYYLNVNHTRAWNDNRSKDELRMLTGWCWIEKGGGQRHAQGLKTITVAYREAYYSLIAKTDTPTIKRPRLRLVRAA